MSKAITTADADRFAAEWFEAWNTHDLDRILSHYHEDVVFTSPLAVEFAGGDGTVVGKAALRSYWEAGLRRLPDLQFVPIHNVPGLGSLTLVYKSVRNLLAAEVLELGPDGRVTRGSAHYRPME